MIIGIVGIGLIGGSFAKAYKAFSDNEIYALDTNQTMLELALLTKAVDKPLSIENMADCDCIFITLYPKDTIKWLEENSKYISEKTLVMDCCGVKESVCKAGFRLAKKYGFTFVGGHPMAGSQYSGFKYSKETLFKDASIIVVPEDHNNLDILQRVKNTLKPLQFAHFTISTAEKHDAMIAFTSQMPHLVSNAFIKSPTALEHKGYSAGSLKDFTRVAYLNEDMWAELFLENKTALSHELDILISSLNEYKDALDSNNFETLKETLSQGKNCKIEVDIQCK